MGFSVFVHKNNNTALELIQVTHHIEGADIKLYRREIVIGCVTKKDTGSRRQSGHQECAEDIAAGALCAGGDNCVAKEPGEHDGGVQA